MAVRDALDRGLHPRRRRRSVRRLKRIADGGEVSSVLFVCLGNVCRSPYAAWSLASKLNHEGPTGVHVDSAGFIGPGRSPPEKAIAAAVERGVHHEENVSKVVTPEMIRAADVLFVFDKLNLRRLRGLKVDHDTPVFLLGDLDSRLEGKRAVVDPWGKSLDEFRRTFERIDRCLNTVRGSLWKDIENGAVSE